MSRKSSESDSQVINNSIALLQERFKQLQRAKEMREERELLKQLTESKRTNSAKCYDPSRLFFHSELIAPPKQPLQGSPSVQHNLQSMHGDLRAIETPTAATLQYTETVAYRSRNCEDSDIDTSLHL